MLVTPLDPAKATLLDAILPHVPFEGWSQAAYDAALAQTEMNPDHARTLCPRGALDLAIAYHQQGDAAMVSAMKSADLRTMRYNERVAFALRARIAAVTDKEAVRRATAVFSLPQHAADGARLIWGTADLIWDTLGDTATDVNWYTKRATLSAVFGATVLYWLGDDSADGQATDAFIDRRIADVMQVEKVKAQVNANPLLKPITGPLNRLLDQIKAPTRMPDPDLPGSWTAPR